MAPAPSAQKLMAEAGLAEADITGSGRRGQILKEDVLAATAQASPPLRRPLQRPPAAPKPVAKAGRAGSGSRSGPPRRRALRSAQADEVREERVKMTRLRQTIARRLKEAQNTAAMLTTFNEVDMKPVMDLRNQYKELFEKKHGVKLGFMGFFTKAVTHALKEIPAVNAEIDGDELIYKNYAHVGVAVGTDKGLVVPVVRDADQLSIAADRKGDRSAGPARPRRRAVDGRHAGRHLHHLERRRLRLADVDADPQCPAVGHPRACTRSRSGRWWSAARSSSGR